MSSFAILDAPSILGLRPTGVENLPKALKTAGLLDHVNVINSLKNKLRDY